MARFWVIFVAVFGLVFVQAVPETVHMVQTDSSGITIQMDVTFDTEEKTVHVVVGDVSQYPGSVQSVNFHDYNTGYGVLKIVNRQICLLARALVPMATPEKYRMGMTTEVHEHDLKFAPDMLSNRDVDVIAGPKIAAFCKDYATYFTIATEVSKKDRTTRAAVAAEEEKSSTWCVFSKCSGSKAAMDQLASPSAKESVSSLS